MKTTLVSNLIYWVASLLASTLRLTLVGEEKIEESRGRHGGVILVGWHGRSFLPITHYRGRGYWSFISTSRDGNIQNKLFEKCGFRTVRGSTSARGAVASALRMAKELREGAVLAHTPDGPRGPIHVVHPGAIFLAEKSGCPIIPAGISCYPSWRLNTWDAYQVPKPFARGTIVLGDPVHVPSQLSDSERQELCRRVGEEMCALEAEAEALVQTFGTACPSVETRSS